MKKRHGGGDEQDIYILLIHFADSQHQLPKYIPSLRASWLLKAETESDLSVLGS